MRDGWPKGGHVSGVKLRRLSIAATSASSVGPGLGLRRPPPERRVALLEVELAVGTSHVRRTARDGVSGQRRVASGRAEAAVADDGPTRRRAEAQAGPGTDVDQASRTTPWRGSATPRHNTTPASKTRSLQGISRFSSVRGVGAATTPWAARLVKRRSSAWAGRRAADPRQLNGVSDWLGSEDVVAGPRWSPRT